MLGSGLKLSTGCTDSETSQEVQAKIRYCLCSAQGHLARATKQSADGWYLCWAWRCLGEAKLQTTASCHLARSTGHAEDRCCSFERF